NVGEMTKAGFPVPPGVIVTSIAYREFLKENNLEIKIKHLLGTIDYSNPKTLENASRSIMHEIEKGKMSQALIQEIFSAYSKLGGALKDALVAVVSSQTR